jgi:hypothetical protein
MAAPYPVSVRIGTNPQAFIIDAGFALAPMGLLVTLALARNSAVWLPRGLLNLLDNDRLYCRDPAQMGGSWLPGEGRDARLAAMADELPAWQRAWHYGKLSARVHWIGDAQYESALADREDSALLPRFEHCAAALDAKLVGCGHDPVAPLDECARDAVALAAALQPDPALLLTLPDDGGLPPLCTLLDQVRMEVRRRLAGFDDAENAALEAARIPLEASGSRAAVVRIVAPAVLSLPDSWDEGEWPDTPAEAGERGDDVWRNACALWQPLAALETVA